MATIWSLPSVEAFCFKEDFLVLFNAGSPGRKLSNPRPAGKILVCFGDFFLGFRTNPLVLL